MAIIEFSTINYEDDSLLVKKAMSHLQTLCETQNAFILSEPTSRFGWTFFKLAIKGALLDGIENKFADMIQKYRGKPEEKFTKFMMDFFDSRGCKIKLKLIEY